MPPRRLPGRLADGGHPVRCLVRDSSDTSLLDELDVEIAVGDLTRARSLAAAVEGCSCVLHGAALVSDWATTQESAAANVGGTRNLLRACADASVRRFVHFSTTDIYGHPGGTAIDETYTATRFANWYSQTKRDAEAEVRRVMDAGALDTVVLRPATVYGPGSHDVIGEIAKAIRARNMLLIDAGRAIAGLCYVENLVDAALLALSHPAAPALPALSRPAAPGQAFNVSDGLAITWRQFADDLAEGLDCPRVRWSLPYRLANGIGFSLEHGYRLMRATTGLSAAPLLSRQAVQVLGINQDFSNRRARETLGWEPRVGYADGLRATLDWLRTEYLGHA